jgi:hypothetical protein
MDYFLGSFSKFFIVTHDFEFMKQTMSEIIIEAHTSMIKMSAKSWAWT